MLLHRRMVPHTAVHRRREDHGTPRGQYQRTEEIVGHPQGTTGKRMSGGRDDHDEVSLLGQREVKHLLMRGKQIRRDWMPRQDFESKRSHEARGRLGHDDRDIRAF